MKREDGLTRYDGKMRPPTIWILGLSLGAIFGGGLVAIGYAMAKPSPQEAIGKTYALSDDILVHGNEDLKEIALTFDDGPRPEIVRGMLNTLGQHGVRATFFVVGSQVEAHPAIVRRMMDEGHEVANHTYSHPRLAGMDAAAIKAEMAACDRAVMKATGAQTNLFRPPGMRYDDTVIRAAQDLGYVTVHWNVAAQDYQPLPPSLIARKVLTNVRPGSVILLHSHPDTASALPEILAKLKADGYRFVTVSQMLGRLPRPVYVKTNAYGAKPIPVEPTTIARPTSRKKAPNLRTPASKPAKPTETDPERAKPSVVDLPTG